MREWCLIIKSRCQGLKLLVTVHSQNKPRKRFNGMKNIQKLTKKVLW